MSTHSSWHLCLLSSVGHIVIPGGQEEWLGLGRRGLQWTGCSWLLYPLPSHATEGTVSALCSSTSAAGRWACCDGPLPRQHLCAGMQWHSSCGDPHRYWGGGGTTTLEQEGLEWLLRSKLVSLCVKTWRKRRRV